MHRTSLKAPPAPERMIESYRHWIRDARGLTRMTEVDRVRYAKELLAFLVTRKRTLASATPLDVDAYFAENSSRWCRLAVRKVCGHLKDFLSYATQRRWCDRRLGLSIVAPRIYPQEGLPYHAPWSKIVAMLRAAAKDRSGTGRRAYAILILLATYGVRSSEVARLELRDIDWREETIFFNRSKGGRNQPLRLVPAVGEAILRYVSNARHNESGSRNLFLRADAPYAAIGNDVDTASNVATVRETKFYKTRIVPYNRTIARKLDEFLRWRREAGMPVGPEAPLFARRDGTSVRGGHVRHFFHVLCENAGIATQCGGLHVHDLRHSFAVRRLVSWYREGRDVQALLPKLSVYMGHSSVASTSVYLSMTPELLSESCARFERYAMGGPRHE